MKTLTKHHQAIAELLTRHPNGLAGGLVAKSLGLNKALVGVCLTQLQELGLVQQHQATPRVVVWSLRRAA